MFIVFWFCVFTSFLWIVYFGIETWIQSMIFCWYILWYSDGTCSVSEGAVSPPPGHAPPARRAVLPGVLYKRLYSYWSYIIVCYWGVWVHQGKVLSWVGICVSWFHGIVGERKLNKRKITGGGGRQLGTCSHSASLNVFQVNFHHSLEHLSCFDIFGKSNIL